MSTTNPMFRPFQYKSLSLANRVVMAPMTRSKSPDGTPGEDVATYYRRRAEGGVGLIITEGTTVDRAGASNDPNIPNFYAPKSLDGWRRVVKEVHAAGAKIARKSGIREWCANRAPGRVRTASPTAHRDCLALASKSLSR